MTLLERGPSGPPIAATAAETMGGSEDPRSTPDTVTLELIKGAIRSARGEMEALIDRTAMSPFIREKKDFFTAFFDRDGKLVAGTSLPMAGNLIGCVLEAYPAETMRDGDLYWYNDCYGSRGAVSHMPDMVFVAPVFAEGRLFAFAEAWGHLWDIGGMTPGSISPDATDVYQEGIAMPPSRIYAGGVLNEELFRVFVRNSRYPEMVKGDLNAILAACRLGRRRLEELASRFGPAAVTRAFAFMMQQSEQALRQAFRDKVPDGSHSFRDLIDSDAVTDRSYAVALTLHKQGDRIALDFSGSDDQAQGPINFIMDESVPKYMAGLFLTKDEPGVQMNAGFERVIGEVTRRPGSLVDPRPPAPLGLRSHTMLRVNSTLLGTFAAATGGQASAASCVYVLYYLRSITGDRVDLCIEGLGVGFGARTTADGIDAVYYVAQKNYPVEFAEMEFGVRIDGYRIHRDSGGPGRWRGGCGIVRDVRIVADEAVIAFRLDNVRHPAWGVAGGHGGRTGRILLNPGTPGERELKPMSEGNRLARGDLVRIMTSGGGGWGSPLDRPAAQVRDDVLDGFVSPESAFADYGVALAGEEVDEAATDERRRALRSPTKLVHRREYFDAAG